VSRGGKFNVFTTALFLVGQRESKGKERKKSGGANFTKKGRTGGDLLRGGKRSRLRRGRFHPGKTCRWGGKKVTKKGILRETYRKAKKGQAGLEKKRFFQN